MKKILLLVSAIALTASCTKTELGNEAPKAPVKGIGFEVQTGGDTKAQYLDGARKTIWYAEQDQIGILYKNVRKATAGASTQDLWFGENNQAIYKATTSGSRGFFTSDEEGDYLVWTKDADGEYIKASFRAYWPKQDLAAGSGAEKVLIPQLDVQDQVNMVGAETVEYNFMTAETLDVTPKESYNSVGETANLQFKSQFVTATFAIKNAKATFGKLQSITFTADATGNTTAKTSSILATGDKTGTYDFAKKALSNGSTPVSEIKLTFNGSTGLDPITQWSNDALAYMSILPVDRKVFTDAKEKEKISIVYKFEYTTYTKEIETDATWSANQLLQFNEKYPMDFDAIPAYYVEKGSDYYVYLNSGSFSALQDSKDVTKLLVNGKSIEKAKVKGIYSKVALTLSELATLDKYTVLEEIELAENTVIPSKTFTQTGLTSIVMPKVNDIAADGFAQQTSTTNVILSSYEFKNKEITNRILVSGKLETLDMSSVERVGDIFPAAGITLNGFTALKTVTVKSGVLLGSGSFKQCTSLKEVKFPVVGGSVQLVGSEVFSGAKELTSISISNVEIPVSSFEGCAKLATVVNGSAKAIQPTKIYENAFKGTGIVDIDLSQATIINKAAFENCTALVGAVDPLRPNIKVLYVNGITELKDNVFKGCTSLKYVSFANVTTVGTGMFEGIILNEVEFLKPFASTTIAAGSFGTITGTTLFVNAAQEGVTGSELLFVKDATDSSKDVKFTFAKITTSL